MNIDADRVRFARLIATHQERIDRIVRRLLVWPAASADIQDLVQDVFLTAWMKRHQFQGDAALETWLTRIALNKARNFRRTQRTARRAIETFRYLWDSGNIPEADYPETTVLVRDQACLVRRALSHLRHGDREILVLRYLEEESITDIQRLLGLGRNTVDARLSRARKRLETILRRLNFGEDHE